MGEMHGAEDAGGAPGAFGSSPGAPLSLSTFTDPEAL